jgi:hypothetical protein
MLIATVRPQAMLPERNVPAVDWLNLPANRSVRTTCIDYASRLVVQRYADEPQRHEEHQERREIMLGGNELLPRRNSASSLCPLCLRG